jgi:hypothetical protein
MQQTARRSTLKVKDLVTGQTMTVDEWKQRKADNAEQVRQIEAYRHALQRITDTLRDHPDVQKESTRVYFAYMTARNATERNA